MSRLLLTCFAFALLAAAAPAQESRTAAETIPPPDVLATALQLKRAARQSFGQGDPAAAREHLAALLTLYRQHDSDEPDRWSNCLAEVAREYLRAGELKLSLTLLGEAADLNPPFPAAYDDGLASAAGGLHRRLAALDADERFELLHRWSMPASSRQTVRVLIAITPTAAPPPVFARGLGERIRRDSFAVPAIAEVRGLFCSAWELAHAAEESGNLRRLTAELSQLAGDDVPNARFALTLAKIVAARRADDSLLDELKAPAAQPDVELVIAAACLTQDWLQPVGERKLKAKLEQTYGRDSPSIRAFLRQAYATAVRHRYPDSSPDIVADANLKWWIPARVSQPLGYGQGAVQPMWLAHEDHIQHVAGPGNDQLLFKYPLTGEFQFSCETQNGGPGGTEGGVTYGGLDYEVSTSELVLRVSDADGKIVAAPHNPFAPNHPLATFNRLSLTSMDYGVTLSSNQHAAWTDDSKHLGSPWIGLRSVGERAPMFRNLKIEGNPIIPRQVMMAADNLLRGWVLGNAEQDEWIAREGVIYDARLAADGDDAVLQSHIAYQRPLLDGDSISYEFQYEPGQLAVHPTLGRIAFLLEPDGVSLHWMTAGDREWTGLAADNSVVEPLNRRGPKPLPLVAGEWNRVLLALKNDTLTVSLNDTTVYARAMEPDSERSFGFYHDRNRSEVRVRNCVMRGDWPERLTDQQLDNLAALSNPDRSASDRGVLGAIFDDQHVHGSVLAIHRRATKLTAEERYALLSEWVLPGADHHTLRLALDFTPTNPAPPVNDEALALGSGQSRVTTGGDLVSPALDLVAAAKELGKLDELRERIASMSVADEQQHRSQLCMLALVDIAFGDLATAKGRLDELASSVAASPGVSFSERWPSTLAIWEAARFAETRDAVRDMAYQIIEQQIRTNTPSGYEAWDSHMRALAGRVRYFDLRDGDLGLPDESAARLHGQSPLANWVLASQETIRTRGQGFPRSRWELTSPATVEKFASHDDDYLFYRSPLRGNFEVECDVSGFGWRESSLWVAGRWVAPVYTHAAYDVGEFRTWYRVPLDPPLSKTDEWIRYRAVVRDGVCITYFNGRKVDERALAAGHDPWIAIRGPYTTDGAVRNLRITGQPEIPAEVRLAAEKDLPGWLPINHGHLVGPNRKWQYLGDPANDGGIRGIRWDSHPGSNQETLLRYHRPMVENGTIEYEFYYREGSIHVHPALDRLAFLLDPDGVRVHWVTDCEYDRTGLAPDNRFDEPGNRRGAATLPLNPNAWNRLQLSLTDDTVDLTLNGQLIYQRELESTNQRTFGVFHYADQTEAYIRNIVWRGDWPRELPPLAKQELAGEGAELLDESLAHLTAAFDHDFAADGLPIERIGMLYGTAENFDEQPDGLHVTRHGGEGYLNAIISPRLSIHGDFDIIAAFDQFEANPVPGGGGGLYLQAVLDSDKSDEYLIGRRKRWNKTEPQTFVQASFVAREVGGARRTQFKEQTVEATSGRLRVARRGDQVTYLFAEGDSPNFRVFGTHASLTDDIQSLRLMTQAQGEGLTKVVWKRLTIRAEELSGLAMLNNAALLQELDQQRTALPQRFEHDFATQPQSNARFIPWGQAPQSDERGLQLISVGTDNWSSSGLLSQVGLEGDFDIALALDEVRFGKPKENQNSAVYLQLEFPDANKTQASVIFVEYPDGNRQVYAQIRVVDAAGEPVYRRLRVAPVDAITQIRIARRGKSFSFIYRNKEANDDQLIAQSDVSDLPIPRTNIRIMLHTGGAGVQSEILLKHFSVHADKIAPNPAEASR